MRTVNMMLVGMGLALAASPASAAITTCPTFTKNITNVLCLFKDPHFDKRTSGTGSVYCSTANGGTPNGEIQVDKYARVNGSSVWQGSCKASCTNPSAWPPLLNLPDVTGALCP